MADWGVLKNKSTCFESTMKDNDFNEEDVWSVTNEREDFGYKIKRVSKDSSGSSSAWPLPTAPKRVNSVSDIDDPFVKGSSAPMNIPDWSKVYGKNVGGDYGNGDDWHDDEDGDMVPPHEWIARKLARNQISSFSVFEGMGRTLKGRDLSKVRNAILTKTGFIE